MSSWKKQFAAGWMELAKMHRLARATYIVEEGIEAGKRQVDIVASLATTEWPLSKGGVSGLIDLYAYSRGVKVQRAELSPPSARDLQHAISQYETDESDVSEAKIESYVKRTGASRPIAKRILQVESIAVEMVKEGDVVDGELQIEHPDKAANAARKESRQREAAAGKTHDDWMKAYQAYSDQVVDFLAFLRAAKQDTMLSGSVPRQLKRFAAQIETQADRFEVGVAKTQAREAARTT